METTKPLARAGYWLAATLVIIPLSDAVLPLLPLRLGDERWRWAASGQFSNVMLVPLLGLLIAISLAALTDGRRIRRVVGAVSGIMALLLAVMAVFFVLDYFQVRTLANPNAQHAMAVASTTAFIKDIASIITLVLFSRAGFTGPKVSTTPRQVRTIDNAALTTASPLLGLGGTRPARPE